MGCLKGGARWCNRDDCTAEGAVGGKRTVAKELTKHYVDKGEEKKWQKMNKEQITGKGGI